MKSMIVILIVSLCAIGGLVWGASSPIVEMALVGNLLLVKLSLGLVAVCSSAIAALGIKTILELRA